MKARTFAISLVLLFGAVALTFAQAWVPLANQPKSTRHRNPSRGVRTRLV
jgi:hypothetical protein